MRNGKTIGRLTALLLVCGVLTSCGPLDFKEKYLGIFSHSVDSGTPTQKEMQTQTLRVPYDVNDSLEPYGAHSQLNLSLMPLLYDPLVKLDPQYRPIPYLASSVEVSGTSCTVTLRSDVYFSNGARLTASDVVYSYEQAVGQVKRYPQLIELTSGCTALDGNRVRFDLSKEDQNYPSLLSFPVVPAGSNSETGYPGTGRYRLSSEGRGTILTRNDNHFDSGSPVQTIQLIELPDDEALLYSLRTGAVDFLFSDLSAPQFYNISSSNQPVELNNIVYLGFNQNRELLKDVRFRQLMESYLNKDALVAQVYANRAEKVSTPFLPTYYDLPETSNEVLLSLDERNMALDSLGMSERDGEGYRQKDGKRVRFSLLINAENEYRNAMARQLVNQLGNAGIELTVTELPYSDYKRALATGNFDLFLSEIKIGDNMDITPLLSGASVGVVDSVFDLNLLTSYRDYQAGRISCGDFLTVFNQTQPIIPLVYRRGMVACARNINASILATSQDIFYNISKW